MNYSKNSKKCLPYDVGPARAFLGEAEKTTLCVVLGPASRVKEMLLNGETRRFNFREKVTWLDTVDARFNSSCYTIYSARAGPVYLVDVFDLAQFAPVCPSLSQNASIQVGPESWRLSV